MTLVVVEEAEELEAGSNSGGGLPGWSPAKGSRENDEHKLLATVPSGL